MKQHVGADGKNPFAMSAQVDQTDAGDDLMRAALQAAPASGAPRQVGAACPDFIVKKHQRVRAQHQRVGNFFGDGARLAMGVELANSSGERCSSKLRDVAGHDLEIHIQQLQQLRAAG